MCVHIYSYIHAHSYWHTCAFTVGQEYCGQIFLDADICISCQRAVYNRSAQYICMFKIYEFMYHMYVRNICISCQRAIRNRSAQYLCMFIIWIYVSIHVYIMNLCITCVYTYVGNTCISCEWDICNWQCMCACMCVLYIYIWYLCMYRISHRCIQSWIGISYVYMQIRMSPLALSIPE